MQLPIDDVLADVIATLETNDSLVLQAPPGAGKTTRVPIALLQASWLGARKIVMLEPRRLAARAAATFMARQLGEDVGRTVGYRIRFDTRVSSATRIEVVTEGVLTRMLHTDAALEQYGVVIFDEFHERSLHADLGLALTLQSRALLRPDLRIIAMSATLEGEAVATLLDAPVITSTGRSFNVETIYVPRAKDTWIEPAVARVVQHALEQDDGDVLVFLPGAPEIHRTREILAPMIEARTYVAPLFGSLTQTEQDRAIAPSPPGTRKVVLATSIAETSLTIEGVRIVIDSGLMRVPRFDARIGMTRLETITVTRASADQRRGRAGRTAPGICYRMWSEHEDAALIPHGKPEILEADLAPLALDLAAWGISDPAELSWLDAPPASSFSQARELLLELGALDANGAITAHGKNMAGLPVHPRLAHMLLRARELGHAPLACDVAALLSDRRVNTDRIDRGALASVQRETAQFRKLLNVRHGEPSNIEHAGLLLAFAFPDRIAKQRGERGRFLLRNGRGGTLDKAHPSAGDEFIVAAEVEGSGRDSRIFLAAGITEAEIRERFGEQIERTSTVEISESGSVQAIVREQLGAIVLKESVSRDVSEDELARALLDDVLTRGIDTLAWSKSATQLQQRLAFMHRHDPEWPDFSMDALAASAREWVLPHLIGVRGRTAVQKLDVAEMLAGRLTWQQRSQLDKLAPTHLVVPTGSNIFIDYSDPDAPFAAVRLQEVFGLAATPRLAGGRVPLTLHLLSPAQRPVQVTRDLASFWANGYFDVKKELKGRYPKHYWPDDPLTAEATRRAKPRGT
jgi:ATP-dependent helicase HrpB